MHLLATLVFAAKSNGQFTDIKKNIIYECVNDALAGSRINAKQLNKAINKVEGQSFQEFKRQFETCLYDFRINNKGVFNTLKRIINSQEAIQAPEFQILEYVDLRLKKLKLEQST